MDSAVGGARVGRGPGSTLFARTFLSFLAALTILLGLLVGAAAVGLGWSARGWTAARTRERGDFLRSLVLATYRSRRALEAEAIATAVFPYLDDSTYLFVYDPEGSLVFGWRRGELLGSRGASESGQGQRFLARHAGEARPVELRDGGRLVGSVAAGVLSFADDAVNRLFLDTLVLVGGVGAGLAFLLALAVAWLFSSRLSSHAISLSAGLSRLAAGERVVSFDTTGARELAQIGASALTLQSRLAEEERLRRQWAADVAHDLRTPIAALRAQMEAMTDGVLPITPERIARAQAELGRVEALVTDLGELARIESPGMKVELAPVDAARFAEDLYERFAAQAGRSGIVLDRRAEPGLSLRADEHLLLRAASNVVQNALQHAGKGGRVEIRVEGAGDADPRGPARIRVENTGRVPEEEIPRVFDRLYRGEGSRHTPGSGLGLTIARAVLELHGGSISMANTGAGTVLVEMRLPGASVP